MTLNLGSLPEIPRYKTDPRESGRLVRQ